MLTVYKYPLLFSSAPQLVKMPRDSSVVEVGLDAVRTVCIWAEVDTAAPIVTVPVRIFPTGAEVLGAGFTHIGTFFDGPYVWHVYAVGLRQA